MEVEADTSNGLTMLMFCMNSSQIAKSLASQSSRNLHSAHSTLVRDCRFSAQHK